MYVGMSGLQHSQERVGPPELPSGHQAPRRRAELPRLGQVGLESPGQRQQALHHRRVQVCARVFVHRVTCVYVYVRSFYVFLRTCKSQALYPGLNLCPLPEPTSLPVATLSQVTVGIPCKNRLEMSPQRTQLTQS